MDCFIRSASLAGFEALVRSYDVNPNLILKQAGLLPSQLRDPDAFIHYEHYLQVLELAASACEEPCFGFKLANLQNIGTVGLIGAYMSRQATILDALNVAQKYLYLHAEGIVLSLQEFQHKSCELRFIRLGEGSQPIPQKAQLAVCLIFKIMKELVGSKWRVQKICLRQSIPNHSKNLFFQTFGCDVDFNADVDAIYFPSAFLTFKPHLNEALIDKLIANQFERQTAKKLPDEMILIESAIKMLLATGECNKENTALCIGIHPKKLQRTLAEHQTSYRDLLEDIRKKEALRMLEGGYINLTDLALRLGYAELSIFSRRFKQWFGVAPTKWQSTQR